MKFIITTQYGAVEAVRGGVPHTGIDLAMPVGTPLRSFCDAVVERVVDYGRENIGKGVILRANEGTRYIFGHMDKISVHVGEAVHAGSILGLSGNSGHSTGPHLHFAEYRGQYVDPSNEIVKVDQLAGDLPHKSLSDWLTHPFDIKEYAHVAAHDAIMGVMSALGDFALHMGYSVVLIGSGILIILKQCGFEHRWLKPSVLIGAYVLLRYLFGA
jgi:hypothetical protein